MLGWHTRCLRRGGGESCVAITEAVSAILRRRLRDSLLGSVAPRRTRERLDRPVNVRVVQWYVAVFILIIFASFEFMRAFRDNRGTRNLKDAIIIDYFYWLSVHTIVTSWTFLTILSDYMQTSWSVIEYPNCVTQLLLSIWSILLIHCQKNVSQQCK